LEFLNRYEEAKISYTEGLKHDPNNEQLQKGVKQCESHLTGMIKKCMLITFYSHL